MSWKWWSTERAVPNTIFNNRVVGPDYITLLCPVCNSEYSHLDEVFTRFGTDEYEGGHAYTGTVAKGVGHGWRRDGLVIVFTSECGHMWQIIFQQHKGNTFVLCRYAEDRMTDGNPPATFGTE